MRHVYHLSPIRLLSMPLLWLAMVLPLLGLAVAYRRDPADLAAFTAAAIIVTLIFLPIGAIVWQSRLVLTPEGIAHHQFAYTVRSPWKQLQALTLDPGTEALVLAEPGTRSRWFGVLVRWGGVFAPVDPRGLIGDVDLMADGRLILIAPFMAHWRRGPLREDLRRWAPHLFAANIEATP